MRDMRLSDNKGRVILPSGKLKITNKKAELANKKLQEAIEEVQNHFQTNDLRASEMEYVKNTMGIDLEKLTDNAIAAENLKPFTSDLGKAAEQARWRRVAGLEMPSLVRGKKEIKSPDVKNLQFKQTIEVPKVYDKHAFTGETRPLSKLDQLMMKENAGTNQVMAKQVSKIDQPAKIETVEKSYAPYAGKLKIFPGKVTLPCI